jgi:hypothetical protein
VPGSKPPANRHFSAADWGTFRHACQALSVRRAILALLGIFKKRPPEDDVKTSRAEEEAAKDSLFPQAISDPIPREESDRRI